jgi:hypothetical protein
LAVRLATSFAKSPINFSTCSACSNRTLHGTLILIDWRWVIFCKDRSSIPLKYIFVNLMQVFSVYHVSYCTKLNNIRPVFIPNQRCVCPVLFYANRYLSLYSLFVYISWNNFVSYVLLLIFSFSRLPSDHPTPDKRLVGKESSKAGASSRFR